MGSQLDQRAANQGGGTIASFIHTLQPEIDRALPQHMTGDRMARLLLTAVRKTPKLAGCTPASFAGAVLTSSALGLEPNTPEGECYLIPYGQECQLVIGYRGLTKLFWQSPLAKHVDAQPVYENDEFDWAYGTDPYLRHRPASGDRGEVIYYYGTASLTTGATNFQVLTPEDVKALRQGKVGPDPKFKGGDPMKWMERKTALKQALKTMPKATSLTTAIAADETGGNALRRQQILEGASPLSIEAPPEGVDAETGEVLDEDALFDQQGDTK